MNGNDDRSSALGDDFDRVVRNLEGVPDSVRTGVTTERVLSPVINIAQDWTIQTIRQKEIGDWILLTRGSGDKYLRLAIPPQITRVIARQYDQVSTKNRKRGARQAMETRRAAGHDPAKVLEKARAARGKKRRKGKKEEK